jgi:hypothetical protein
MHLLKLVSLSSSMLLIIGLSGVSHAETVHIIEPVKLPTLTVMAEPELRAETGYLPFQEQPQKRGALQQRVMKIERDIQGYTVDAEYKGNIDVIPAQPGPDIGSLPLGLQHYVMAIADGLQSNDPRNGVYVMLQNFGIDRNAINVQIAREQFNVQFPNAAQ